MPEAAPAPRAGLEEQAPPWVTATIGAVAQATRLRSGFTNESWAVRTASGRRLVVTRMAEPGAAAFLLDVSPAVAAGLAAAGIAGVVPLPEHSDRARNVVSASFIAGTSGMDLMVDAGGAAQVGRVAGAAWRAFGAVDSSALGLDDLWARPSALAQAALAWLEPVADSLAARERTDLRARIADLPELLQDRPPGFVHGDLVPANLLIAQGALTALLDLEAVRVGERVLDAAWFRWIVRHHHPEIAPAAWAGFVGASGLAADDTRVALLIRLTPVVRILEILGRPAMDGARRSRWVEQLRAAVQELAT